MTPSPQDNPIDPGGDSDDDALRWAGDEDRGLERPRSATTGSGVSDPVADDTAPHVGRGAAAAAGFAVLYLALTGGWILAVQQTSSGTTVFATELLWQFGEFLAIAAAPLWFGASVALTRDSRVLIRIGWLALGIAVLIPWPLVLAVLASLSPGATS